MQDSNGHGVIYVIDTDPESPYFNQHVLTLQVEDAGQIFVPPQRGVDLLEAGQRLGVVGIEPHHLLEPRRRAGRILQLAVEDLRDPAEELELLVGVGGVLGVQVQHVDQVRRLAGPFQDPLQADQGVAVAGDGLQDLVGRLSITDS